MAQPSAELIAIIPRDDSRKLLPSFLGQCINYGIDFYFEEGDSIPQKVPSGVDNVRAVVLDHSDYEANRTIIEEYSRQGAIIHVFNAGRESGPQLTTPWDNYNIFHQMSFQCGFTVDSPQFREKMLALSEEQVFESLQNQMLSMDETRWYDATRYIWEGLLDGYEVTGDVRYLDLVRSQIAYAMANQENHLENCDCVSPFPALLRLYQIETSLPPV